MSVDTWHLSTARLGFRWWTHDDLPLARCLWGNPEVTRLFTREPWPDEKVAARLATELANARDHGYQYWPLFELAFGAFAGVCGLKPYRPAEGVLEIGYHLLPSTWGRGLASEAAGEVVAHAFGALGAAALFAGHHPDNAASGRVLEKLGFTRTGEEFFEPTGLMHPAYLLRRPAS